ncbi:cytochrome P450 714C2-like [Impatiens glandulifera]|uniref:cytochrome P450 714C2-like n=1 Tax=Impatiens glandulifera TaxID=253017 RepID=UPI001FB19E45|nr:cytochrome P450 714C2-like [Impatiens glandulifera]
MFSALISFGLVALLGLIFRLYKTLVAEPDLLRSKLRKQGLSGPPPSFLLGNIKEIQVALSAAKSACVRGIAPKTHDCASTLLPFLEKWRKLYGEVFMFSLGNIQIVHVTQPDMVKEISTCTSIDLGKPSYQQKERGALLGQGILTSNGTYWVHQRKIIAPELYMDKVKGMTGVITNSALTLVKNWRQRIEASEGKVAEIKIDNDMRSFSGDVISMTCFGSNFSKGKEIFKKLKALQDATSKKGLTCGIPGLRHIPTKHNRLTWALDKEVKTLILKVVKERVQGSYEKDLLQMLLEGAKNNVELSQPHVIDKFIVDNCKNIYLAGYETTAVSAAWCLMLLAADKQWQDRVRAEVVDVCHGKNNLDYDSVKKLNQLNMVIHECLRLYPPVAVVSREALKDMKFGDLNVPKGVNLWALVLTLHTDPEIWGPDSLEFKPERFTNGITGACKIPQYYMPFGVGPRVCLGQNLAMVELKILVALIVSNFSFSLSPNYLHSPALNLVIEPGHGVDILVKKL